MKKLIQLYRIALERNKDLIVFPVVGAAMWFIQTIASPSFEISWVYNTNSWISSFIITLLTYMIFDMVLGRFNFFTEHKYVFAIISFLVSTFIGETLSYQLKEDLGWQIWLWASLEYIAGFIILLIACTIGLSWGVERAKGKIIKDEQNYQRLISQMNIKDKKEIVSICNKALNIDDEVFDLIVCMKSKSSIKEIKSDLQKANGKNA